MNDRARGWWFVLAQFALIGLLILPLGGPLVEVSAPLRSWLTAANWLALALLVVSGLSLGRALTAHPLPNQQGELVTSGLYGKVRHPIYTFLMAAACLMAISDASVIHVLAAIALIVLLNFKARFEERHLRQHYPKYDEYADRTGRFLPRWR